jgi:hypothetical protein
MGSPDDDVCQGWLGCVVGDVPRLYLFLVELAGGSGFFRIVLEKLVCGFCHLADMVNIF